MPDLNETHEPSLLSWVASANDDGSDFTVQNLPFGAFAPRGGGDARCGVAIGDRVLDVAPLAERLGALAGDARAREAAEACAAPALNALMALGPAHWSALRLGLSRLLRAGGADEASRRADAEPHLRAIADVSLGVPAEVGDYTDFYASVYHATNVGSMFRPDNPLLPNYKYVPIGYHGRASSLVPSDTPVRRPLGQTKGAEAAEPAYGPTRLLDYECELGLFVGPGNSSGSTIPVDKAWSHLFGVCLVNDWSARDVQAWEYQPLGPFLAKSFATTVAPWVVTTEALAPYRVAPAARASGDPAPLPYLRDARDEAEGGIDVTLEVWLRTAAMRDRGDAAVRLTSARFAESMYWTPAQLVAHHASNGCNLRPGDLLASGTVSGPERGERGCLLELTWRGAEPIALPDGETRRFLQDGDEVILRGHCARAGAARVGLGECRGVVLPALG